MDVDAHVVKTGKGTKRLVHCKYCSKELPNKTARWISHLKNCEVTPPGLALPSNKRCATLAFVQDNNGRLTQHAQGSSPKTSQPTMWIDRMSDTDKFFMDKAFGKVFYSTGVPFSLANSPALVDFIRLARPAYTPPTAKAVAGSLLDNAHSDMTKTLASSLAEESLVSIVSDG